MVKELQMENYEHNISTAFLCGAVSTELQVGEKHFFKADCLYEGSRNHQVGMIMLLNMTFELFMLLITFVQWYPRGTAP